MPCDLRFRAAMAASKVLLLSLAAPLPRASTPGFAQALRHGGHSLGKPLGRGAGPSIAAAPSPAIKAAASSSYPGGVRRFCSDAAAAAAAAAAGPGELPRRPDTVPWDSVAANRVCLIGYLTRGVELRRFDTGTMVANAVLSVEMKSRAGDSHPVPFYLDFWNDMAQIAAAHLKESDYIFVAGRVKLDTYLSRENVEKTVWKVVVNDVKFVETFHKISSSGESIETLWRTYFDNPADWYDNRKYKFSSTSPDFKHKITAKALWIESKNTPEWVKEEFMKLRLVEDDQKGAADGTGLASLWGSFFANPSDWWDNRKKKRALGTPDFRHKSTGEVLWIDNVNNPSWVKPQLEVLESTIEAAGKQAKAAAWFDQESLACKRFTVEDEDCEI